MKPILVLGATGYTGRLVARELDRRGVPYVAAARDADRLEALAQSLPKRPPLKIASPRDAASLAAALEGCGAVINTVGPFTDLGEPVVRAAVEAKVHYLDITGEQGFIRSVVDGWDGRARAAGVAVMPATAFEFAPGLCAGALAIARLGGSADRVHVTYRALGRGVSHGTAKSMGRVIGQRGVLLRGGERVRERPGLDTKRIAIPPDERERDAHSVPGAEALFLPRLAKVGDVSTFMVLPRRVVRLADWARPLLPILGTRPGQLVFDALVSRFNRPPAEAEREKEGFWVIAEARKEKTEVRCVVSGKDGYGITAVIAAEAAVMLAERGPAQPGVQSVAEAFGAAAFLDRLSAAGVRYEISEPADAGPAVG